MKTLSALCVLCVFAVPTASAQGSKGRSGKPGQTMKRIQSPWDVEAREYLGTPQSEAAVKRGLAYLASNQKSDGHWSSGNYSADVGVTGLCLMAFLAEGNQPGRGRYGLVMNQAVDFLANSVDMGGQFGHAGLVRAGGGGPPMYGHGFATLALAEAYGMTKRRDLRPKLEAAIRLIEDTQNRSGQEWSDGGWRYQPEQRDADLSVTVVQVLALRGARNAGVKVNQAVIDRAIGYMKRCANRDGGFSYQVGQQQSNQARAGAGTLSLQMAGLRRTPECEAGLQYLKERPLVGLGSTGGNREHFYYSIYYITQSMYQAGGDYWHTWYPTIRDYLVRNQDSDGSWGHKDNSEAGYEYATAMACLVLQVPAGLLPIYQK